LDRKISGRYSLEDYGILDEVTNRVAVSMEKEYLREQLREREQELFGKSIAPMPLLLPV